MPPETGALAGCGCSPPRSKDTDGTYDYQRDEGVFYSAYTDASNFAVGIYMAGAGLHPMMQLSP